jgi:predicted nucleotidyltransferase
VNGTIDPNTDYIQIVATAKSRTWPTLTAARDSAKDVRELLSKALTKRFGAFSSGDIELICFGSLARQEWTSGSDVDWTLLIDGQATPDHRVISRDIADEIAMTRFNNIPLQAPGAEGIFGSMAFSHDIIHHIGGQADSNKNTTQRVLLLLEATPVRHEGWNAVVGPFERVTKGVLFRYLHDDTNFSSAGDTTSRIPRFLLNDIVRYWRTMCVDFAYKEWEQRGGKWALRNIKLRLSRKLLFVSGLLAVFSCFKNNTLRVEAGKPEQYVPMMQSHLMAFVHSTPSNILAYTLHQLGMNDEAVQILDCYEEFVAKLHNATVRGHLNKLRPHDVYKDPEFLDLREISHGFQAGLDAVFFRSSNELSDFTVKYGVF